MRTATIYNFLMEANLMAGIAILLMLPIRRFMRKPLGNRVIYFAWLLIAIRLLCPLALPNPAINAIRSPFAMDQAIRPIAGQLRVRFSDALDGLYYATYDSLGQHSAIATGLDAIREDVYYGSLSLYLMEGYLIGVGVVLGWFIVSNLRFRHKLKADRIEQITGKLADQYGALCQEIGITPIPVYFTDPLPSACLVGVFRPYIALPLTAAPQEAIQVLRHEVCHLKGRDQYWGLVRLMCCALHWFNPLVWLAAHLSRTDGELACDDRVVSQLNDQQKLAYANVLVLAASKRDRPGVAVLATGMTMTGRKLKTRVNAIIHNHQAKRGLALAFGLLASMALAGAFATAEYPYPSTPPAVPAQAVIAEHRAIATEAEALDYAQTLWTSAYLGQSADGLTWSVQTDEDRYIIDAVGENPNDDLTVIFDHEGHVSYLRNGLSRFDDLSAAASLYASDTALQDELGLWLLSFADALNPGSSNGIEAFTLAGESVNPPRHFVDMLGYCYGEATPTDDTYTVFTVQTAPEYRVVLYSEGAPMDQSGGNG